jgi:DNA polymerase III subunit chi
MTRIDFHSHIADKINYACRLVRKARAANRRIMLLAKDRTECEAINQALWTFSAADFLPHVLAEDPLAPQTPIVLTVHDASDFPHHEVLINLSNAVPAHFARFERMIEIIGCDAAEVASGRERWLFYKDRGYALTHFTAGTE